MEDQSIALIFMRYKKLLEEPNENVIKELKDLGDSLLNWLKMRHLAMNALLTSSPKDNRDLIIVYLDKPCININK